MKVLYYYTFLYFISIHLKYYLAKSKLLFSNLQSNNRFKIKKKLNFDLLNKLKGGATLDQTTNEVEKIYTGNITVIVATSFGSSYLDKSKRLSISRNTTILELKQLLSTKFPGSPPVQLQKLFYGLQSLKNADKIGNVTSAPQIPILLDMISGTSSYNTVLSVSQAIEAYVSLIIHQTYLSSVSQKIFSSRHILSPDSLNNEENSNENNIDSVTYRELFDVINRTVYNQYGAEIADALEREKEPEVVSPDTASWRQTSQNEIDKNPLTEAFVKQFDTNKQVALGLAYYSVILVVNIIISTSKYKILS